LRLVILHDYVHNEIARGGATRVFLTLIDGFKKARHEVIIAINERFKYEEEKNYFDETAQPDLIYRFRHDVQTVYKDLLLSKKLSSFLQRIHPDAIIQTFGHPILLYKLRCIKFFYVQSWRLIPLTKRIADYKGKRKVFYLPLRLFYRNEGEDIQFVAVSRWVKNNLEKLWRTDAKVIYPPVKLKEFLPLSSKTKTKGKIVSVGKFTKIKRFPDQIEILKLLHKDGVNATLTMIGTVARDTDTVLRAVNNLTRRYKLDEYVEIKLNASRQEVLEEIASSQIFLHTCTREAVGIAPLEGMAAGCIPCVPDSGGVRETVSPEFRFANFLQAKEIIKRSINTSIDVNRFIEEAKKYDEECFIEKWMNLIKETLCKRRFS